MTAVAFMFLTKVTTKKRKKKTAAIQLFIYKHYYFISKEYL